MGYKSVIQLYLENLEDGEQPDWNFVNQLIQRGQTRTVEEFATRLIEAYNYLLAFLSKDAIYIEDLINQELETYRQKLEGK